MYNIFETTQNRKENYKPKMKQMKVKLKRRKKIWILGFGLLRNLDFVRANG